MRRRRASIDLLPLLDVILVVVFVFATIQQADLENAQADDRAAREALSGRLAQTRAQLQQAEQNLAEAAARARSLSSSSATTEAERKALEDKLEGLRKAAEERLVERFGTVERYQADSLMEHLLKRNSILEVELDRASGPVAGSRCCFRSDPRAETWRRCGVLPADPERAAEWLRGDAGPLMEALQETKGGNAMVVVRQGYGAIWQSGERLRQLIRAREPDRRGYVEVLPVEVARGCP